MHQRIPNPAIIFWLFGGLRRPRESFFVGLGGGSPLVVVIGLLLLDYLSDRLVVLDVYGLALQALLSI